ncbi:hypothetical protein R1T08_01860 [Streptomyces sp. SBC-4]|nr:hypothetical protein [Streptomyces sp. SBC-4]MDV5143095.1 hypothetical protein [Streptomyces sp. SBC-4]
MQGRRTRALRGVKSVATARQASVCSGGSMPTSEVEYSGAGT